MARRFLPGRPACEAGTRLRRCAVPHHRDQRHVLSAAAAGQFRHVGRPDPRRFRVRGEGAALPHTRQAFAGHRGAHGKFPWLRPVAPRAEAWAAPVAVPAELPLRPGALRGIPAVAAARQQRGRRVRPPTCGWSAETRRMVRNRCRAPITARGRDPRRKLSRPGLHCAAPPARRGTRLHRRRGVAALDGCHIGLRLLPPARIGSAVHERL